jgi:hypothetical protein
MRRSAFFAAGIALAVAAVAPAAGAVTILRSENVLAAGACQAALPAFEGQVRKRPVAVQNEGWAPAFVTCALESTTYFETGGFATTIGIYLTNTGGATATVTCTLVDAGSGYNNPVYQPKSANVSSGGNSTSILWTAAADNGGAGYAFPAISCNLPPGTGINGTLRRFPEEIGG